MFEMCRRASKHENTPTVGGFHACVRWWQGKRWRWEETPTRICERWREVVADRGVAGREVVAGREGWQAEWWWQAEWAGVGRKVAVGRKPPHAHLRAAEGGGGRQRGGVLAGREVGVGRREAAVESKTPHAHL